MQVRQIPGYPNYTIDTNGVVTNTDTDQVLNPTPDIYGRYKVCLSDHGNTRTFYVHRLVAMIFMEGFTTRHQVEFLDGDKTNYSKDNLGLKQTRRSWDSKALGE